MNKELKDYLISRPIIRQEISMSESHSYVEVDINVITQVLNYIENSIPKEEIEKVIEKIKRYESIARE